MRRVTRNALILLLVVVIALLALVVLSGLLKSGDPYYVTAQPVNASVGGNASAAPGPDGGNASASLGAVAAVNASAAVNGSVLSERQYPYTTAALADGASEPYWKGPWGLKEAFTHSPFDEMDAFRTRNRSATVGGAVVVRHNGTLYRVAVGRSKQP